MVDGTLGSHTRKGSTKMSNDTIVCAGIDTSKRKLDVAIHLSVQKLQVDNTAGGHAELLDWLRAHLVERVGIEASGGYEQEVVALYAAKVLW
jgi:transposase